MNTPILCALLGIASATAVAGGPVITLQPSPASSFAGRGANLTNHIAATTASPPLIYQWLFGGEMIADATNSILVLTNLQPGQAGSYVCLATDPSGSTQSNPWQVGVDPLFTRITSDPAGAVGNCTGVAWGDYNGDGFVDLFVSPFGRSSLLFSNNGNGTFTRILGGSPVTDSGQTFGACWGDYDNDGWLDLFVGVNNQGNDWLYHNLGDGSFAKTTTGAIVSSGGNANNCSWADYDNDGFLDLFVANSDQADFLFRNLGDGTFARVLTNAIALKPGNSQGGSWGDYDNDGLPDLFVSRVNEPNLLYHNRGGGVFVAVTNDPIVRDVSAGQGTSWGDFDNDGYLDMFVANPLTGAKNFLYRNNSDGSFTKITNGPVANDVGGSSSGAWGDYDNDGFLDLFVANRSGFDFLYHNNGDGTFTRVIDSVLARDPASSFSAAWADYDNNGFLDLFVTRFQTYTSALYHNAGNSNSWILLKCEGRISNRAAIGAKVRVRAAIAGLEVWQLREISGGGGLGAQPDLRAHFGLGDAARVDRIRVEWPSGLVQEVTNVPARQCLTMVEADIRISPSIQELPAGSATILRFSTSLPGPIQPQWRLNDIPLPGETNTSLVITNVQAANLGDYTVLVTSPETGLAFTSPAARLRGAVEITQQPRPQNVLPGSNATFRVFATGLGPISYQWQFHGTNLPGANNDAMVVTNVQLAADGAYVVAVSNTYGATLSEPAQLSVLISPTITLQALSQPVVVGGSVTLSVSVAGNPPPFSYRWRRGGVNLTNIILNDTVCFFTVTNVQPAGTNMPLSYNVAVTNLAGSRASANAVLTFLADSDADGLPDEWEIAAGLSATNAADASLDADGDGLSNLQEYWAGTNPNDATSSVRLGASRNNGESTVELRFLAASNKTYTVQSSALGAGGVWSRVADVPASSTNRTVVLDVQAQPGTVGQRFYRLATPRVP